MIPNTIGLQKNLRPFHIEFSRTSSNFISNKTSYSTVFEVMAFNKSKKIHTLVAFSGISVSIFCAIKLVIYLLPKLKLETIAQHLNSAAKFYSNLCPKPRFRNDFLILPHFEAVGGGGGGVAS